MRNDGDVALGVGVRANQLDAHPVFGHQDVEKAVELQVLPVVGIVEVLAGDAAPTARHDANQIAHVVPPHEILDVLGTRALPPQLLLMAVAGDEEVQTVALEHALVPTAVVTAREVRDRDLPAGRGLADLLLHPLLLVLVRAPEPTLASPDVLRAVVAGALGAGRVVLLRAEVVLGLLPNVEGVVSVRVDDEVLGDEALVLHLA
mmetsp:Transcript_24520/g.49182  ORF Transcript_24520/g.49182 Transcript_24520/m.49182 type:complete len:204 (+) Transcript_24520:415-1026(+)